MRFNLFFDPYELFHKLLVYLESAGRIDYKDVIALNLCLPDRFPCDFFRFFAVPVHIYGNIYAAAYNLKLVYCRRSVHVTCAEHRFFALFFEVVCKLAAGGGLTCTLKSDHHIHCKSSRRICQLASGSAHQSCKLVVYDFDYLLSRSYAFDHLFTKGLFLDGCNEFLYNLEVHVRLKQSKLYLSYCIVDIRFG